MLKRIVERYLRSSNEREYEIPFRQLLWAMGYKLFESRTTHHPFEFGKDIKVFHPDKTPHLWVFQTKSGDINQSDWNDMERQLKLMLEMPVNHPNISPNEPVQGIWVCTGDLKPTVAEIMAEFNKKYIRQGILPVEVWNINKLVDLFIEYFFDVNICPDEIMIEVISLLSGFKKSDFDMAKLDNIVKSLIKSDLPQQSKRIIHKTLSTVEIIAYYVLGRAYDVDDLYSAVEALENVMIHIWKFGKSQSFQYGELDTLEGLRILFKKTIDDLLNNILGLIYQNQGLYTSSDGMAGIIVYPHRTVELMGTIAVRAWLALEDEDQNTFDRCIEHIEAIIENNPSASHPIWERALEDIAITGFVLWQANRTELATKWIAGMAQWLADLYSMEGGGLARPYASEREVIEQLLGIYLTSSKTEPVRSSYLCYLIIELCYWLSLEDIYVEFVEKIPHVHLIEFEYDDIDAIFEHNMTSGRRFQVVPPPNWTEYQEWYRNRYETTDPVVFNDGISEELQDNLWLLLIVSSYFGNRIFPFIFRSKILSKD